LVAFKAFSTFQINGVFGAADFSIQRAQTDLGCMAPRTIQFIPGYGIARMTHLGIAVFDGVRDRLISEEIRPYIFGGQSDITPMDWNYVWFSKACQVSIPPMYACAVPLRNIFGTSSLTFSASRVLIGGTGLNAGTYFVELQAILTNGQTISVGTEQSAVMFGTHSGLQINFPVLAGVSQWKVLYGTGGSGSEGLYFLITAAAAIAGGNIATFDGSGAGISTPYLGGATSNLGQMSRILCYDLVLRGWIVVDLPFSISTLKQYRSIGTIPITTMTGFSDGALRRWQAGDPTWDAGAVNAGAPDAQIRWKFRTPEVFGKDASDRVYFRQLVINGVGSPSSIQAQQAISGIAGNNLATRNVSVTPMGGNQFMAYAEIGITGVDAHADISGIGGVEIDSVDWLAVVKAIRGRITV